MQEQNVEMGARICGNAVSATQRFSPDQTFNPVESGEIQTAHSLRRPRIGKMRTIQPFADAAIVHAKNPRICSTPVAALQLISQ